MPEELGSYPLVYSLNRPPDWNRLLRRFSRFPHAVFLDSAVSHAAVGRYSYLAADPFQWTTVPLSAHEPLKILGQAVREYSEVAPAVDGLPPFQGGAMLLLAYDLNQSLDGIPAARYAELDLPAISFGLYDVVLAWDHERGQGWLISQGLPELRGEARRVRAAERLAQFRQLVEDSGELLRPELSELSGDTSADGSDERSRAGRWGDERVGLERLGIEQAEAGRADTERAELEAHSADGGGMGGVVAGRKKPRAPQFATWGPRELTSNFSKEAYLQAVEDAVEYVRAGDVFQVNIAQTLLYPATTDSVSLYQRLRRANPAPFAAYFDLGEAQVLSASPERFLRVDQGHVEARPIKGTRPRRAWPVADLYAGVDLRTSSKDLSENIMIVDLMRNDLARVCRSDSVRVSQLCQLESYEFVQHLVSAIEGDLPADCELDELLAATFPGGSVTGAPKIRAMQIISELEPTARGAYCGSLGYWAFSGSLDLSILIRTITAGAGWWQFAVGGGIVADSDPVREYEETWHKATGMLRSILPARRPGDS